MDCRKTVLLVAAACMAAGFLVAAESSGTCSCRADAATGCSKGLTPGAKRLASWLRETYGKHETQGFNCRKIAGSNSYSLHAEGRAIDFVVPLSVGARVFKDLQTMCKDGIQEVIHNKRIWTPSKGVHAYKGSNPHTDHVHIGLNKCGAKNFRG